MCRMYHSCLSQVVIIISSEQFFREQARDTPTHGVDGAVDRAHHTRQ